MDNSNLKENLISEGENEGQQKEEALESKKEPEVFPVEPQPLSIPTEQPVPTVPVSPVQTQDDKVQIAPIQKEPGIVDDEAQTDFLEKPWIDKAEEIIEENKEDPYNEEEKQEELQTEYLKKRFGKELKKSDEEN